MKNFCYDTFVVTTSQSESGETFAYSVEFHDGNGLELEVVAVDGYATRLAAAADGFATIAQFYRGIDRFRREASMSADFVKKHPQVLDPAMPIDPVLFEEAKEVCWQQAIYERAAAVRETKKTGRKTKRKSPSEDAVKVEPRPPACTCAVRVWSGIHLPDCPRGRATGPQYRAWEDVPNDVLTEDRYAVRHGHPPPICPGCEARGYSNWLYESQGPCGLCKLLSVDEKTP
jgi:hypothetical protein